MTATPVLERALRKMFRHRAVPEKRHRLARASRATTMDDECREVLESVRRAMRRKTMEPACNAACRFLLQHLTAIPPSAARPRSARSVSAGLAVR
jgi:hypothetical protein